MRTPYPNVLGTLPDGVSDMVIDYMVGMFGLTLAIQDTRGTGKSGGEPDAFFSDWMDGSETVDWLVSQDWCDGQVMQFGLSALAIPGYLAAPNAPDGLKCQFLGEGAPDMYNLAAFHGGVFKKDTVESWLSWVGASSKLSQLSDHRNCDEFWDPLMLDRIEGDVHAAAMHIGGWYDVFVEGIITGYLDYSERGDQWASGHQYLVIGPWDHWSLAQALGETSSPGFSMQNALISFLSFCLAGDTSQVSGWPHVRYFVMGSGEDGAPGNEWRTADDWPLPTKYETFEIADDGSMIIPFEEPPAVSGDASDTGSYTPDVVDATEVDTYEFEPVLPAAVPFDHTTWSPVVGGRNLTGTSGRLALNKVLARDDYVMFSTAPLSVPFESVGRMSLVLDVSTAYPDADVIVRLADVDANGTAWIVSDGAQRLSRRGGCEAPVEVESGSTYEIEVDLLSSALVFNTGHRLAVIVTSTMYPKYELNPSLQALSKESGPLADAFVIHGGRLKMPVVYEIPDVVEEVEVAEDVGGPDAVEPQPDVVEPEIDVADVADGVNDDTGTVANDVSADDPGADAWSPDVRDASQPDTVGTDLVEADAFDGPDSGSGNHAGDGCSSGAAPQSTFPFVLVSLLFAGAVAVTRRRGA